MAQTEPYRGQRPGVKPERAPTANPEPRGPRRYYLSPVLVARAASYCRDQKRLSALGGLVLALNALHACAAFDGRVMVSQQHVANAAGGLSARWARAMEAELFAAGLVRKSPGSGRRRVLVLVSAEELEAPQAGEVLHSRLADCGKLRAVGTPVPTDEERAFLLDADSSKDRARVQKEEGVSTLDVTSGADREALIDALSRLARSSRATATDAARMAVAASELEEALGGAALAADALDELRPWVLRIAHSNPAALAVRAIRSRAQRAVDRLSGQGKLFA